MENFTQKQVFPCEPATEQELWNTIEGIAGGSRNLAERLRQITTNLSEDQIPWASVHSLLILGNAVEKANTTLRLAGIKAGIYVDNSGSFLILIHPQDSELQPCIDRCGNLLSSLMICNTTLTRVDFSKTTALKKILLHLNRHITSIDNLERLSHLTQLHLYGCSSLTQLPSLESITLLTSLKLSGCSSLTQLPSLENLSQLTSLTLYDCSSLTQLSPLKGLSELTEMNLSGCRNLTQLPSLENLSQLTSLTLCECSRLTELPSLEHLSQLTAINLSGCRGLTQLPSLKNLSQLTSLILFGCSNISELPEDIRSLKQLRRLDLSFMKFHTLPHWLPKIAERFSRDFSSAKRGKKAIVNLYKTTVEDIPDMSIFEQPYEMVVKWFEDRKSGNAQPLNEIKVVFLGDGEAGKSHTIARLMNDGGEPLDYTDRSTPGIVIKHKNYTGADGREFQVHYWDFGGQEIMHSMHRIFLTGRTMYVVLLNARDDTQSDRAKYWLHNIKSFAPDAPVLLALNKIDQNENASVDKTDLSGRYPKLTQIVKLSALTFSKEKFNKDFTDVLIKEIEKTGYLDATWPTSWTMVKKELENMSGPYISGDDYRKLCDKCDVADNQENLLLWFNDLGVSFCCRDEKEYTLEDYVILRPDWITNALYIILFNPLESARNGLIPHRSIHRILKNAGTDEAIRCTLPEARYNNGDIQYVLGIMRKFNLSFMDNDQNEFIPMLCQQNSMVNVQSYHQNSDILEFNMEFDYLPSNLLHRLMVERSGELDKEKVWRTGATFRLPELGLSAVVVIDDQTLRFFIRHANPMHRPNTYLAMLKANVDRIVKKMGLTPPACVLIYKHENKVGTFDYEELLQAQEDGETVMYSKTWRKRIPIEDILNQSAPEGLDDEMKLLDAIIRSCHSIQDEPGYRLIKEPDGRGYINGHGMEDLRNRRVCADLEKLGFKVADQHQQGSSGSGIGIGELDALIYDDSGEQWTILEALRVSDGGKTDWNEHLDKLINKYNTRGLPRLYLLTYVDADPKAFARIWKGYEEHIPTYDPEPYAYMAGSYNELPVDTAYIKAAKCRYSCGGDPITVYHIFVRIPTQGE